MLLFIGEGYAVIRGTDDGLTMHVLVSEETRFPTSSALAFNYHWTNPLTRLRVCLDGLDNCLWQADEQSHGGGNWSLGLVALPPGQHRVRSLCLIIYKIRTIYKLSFTKYLRRTTKQVNK